VFRISRADEAFRTIVTVDGQLLGDSVVVVEKCCDQALAAGRVVHLFLRDVSTVDRAGRALLGRLAGRGVRLLAEGVYNSYLVGALRQDVRGEVAEVKP